MARRVTSLTKGRAAAQDSVPAENSEPMKGKSSRRGAKLKANEAPSADTSMDDAFLPDSGDVTSSGVDAESTPTAKGRRSRKPTEQPDPEPVALVRDGVEATGAASSVEQADAVSSSAAAQWNAETDTVTFDWPAIEAVAAVSGANQAMAKLLLAARAEGANSRWPF